MKTSFLQMLCAVALSCVVGLAFADPNKDESGKGGERDWHSAEKDWNDKKEGNSWKEEKDRNGQREWNEWTDDGRGSYFQEHGYSSLSIPPGHYPPPGECRIWYPDRPPGHQPPPGNCRNVPPGAWLIRHPEDRPDHVHVVVYEPNRPGDVYVVGEFEIGSGSFVRVVLDM